MGGGGEATAGFQAVRTRPTVEARTKIAAKSTEEGRDANMSLAVLPGEQTLVMVVMVVMVMNEDEHR